MKRGLIFSYKKKQPKTFFLHHDVKLHDLLYASYQLLLTGQVRTFRVEVPQGSGAQLLLGLAVQQLGCSGAGEQQQRAEERPAEQPGDLHGPGARQRVTLFPSQIVAPQRQTPFYLTPAICSLHLILWFFFFLSCVTAALGESSRKSCWAKYASKKSTITTVRVMDYSLLDRLDEGYKH